LGGIDIFVANVNPMLGKWDEAADQQARSIQACIEKKS